MKGELSGKEEILSMTVSGQSGRNIENPIPDVTVLPRVVVDLELPVLISYRKKS